MRLRLLVGLAATFSVLSATLAIASFFNEPSGLVASGTREATINVYPQELQGAIAPELSGQQLHSYFSRIWDKNTGVINQSTIDYLQPLGINNLRWPGGLSSRVFRWAEAIGPLSIRSNLPSWIEQNKKIVFGIDELARQAKRLSSNPSLTITLNSYQSAAEAADLVEYAVGQPNSCANFNPSAWLHGQGNAAAGYQPGSMPAGYYACLRAHPDYGNSPEPYNVKYFEVGNEDYSGPHDNTPPRSIGEYRDVLVAFSNAVKGRVAGAKIGAVIWPDPASNWNDTIYRLGEGVVDFYIIHVYSGAGLKSAEISSNYEINIPFNAGSSGGGQTFKITARGSRGEGNVCPWPIMQAKLNQTSAQSFSVNSGQPQTFTYTASSGAGAGTMQLGLVNECYQPEQRANTKLYIDKVEHSVSGNFVTLDLITGGDFARAQTENARRLVVELTDQARRVSGKNPPPILATEYNTDFRGLDGSELELNRSLLSTFFVASFYHHLLQEKALGSNPWILQELCSNCRGDLIYYDLDQSGSRKEANGTPYGNANYWFFRQIADSGPLSKVRAEVAGAETYRPPVYLHPNPRSDVPFVQTWAIKKSDGSVRVHVIYTGDEELNLRIKINGYSLRSEIDVAQIVSPEGSLSAYNSAENKERIVSASNRLEGDADQTFLVGPMSITSFTYYPPGADPPPPGGGGGSIYRGSSGTARLAPRPSSRQRGTSQQADAPATPEVLPQLVEEGQPKVITKPSRLLDNPWFLPTVSTMLGLLALSFWITVLWKRHLYYQYQLSKVGVRHHY